MSESPNLRLVCAVLFLGACTSAPVNVGNQPLTVSVAPAEDLTVRGYRLDRVPAILESVLRDDLAACVNQTGTVQVRLRNSTYQIPAVIRSVRTGDDGLSITWFDLDYTLVDAAGETLATGTASAEGPEPRSFSSIELHEIGVSKNAANKIRQNLCRRRT